MVNEKKLNYRFDKIFLVGRYIVSFKTGSVFNNELYSRVPISRIEEGDLIYSSKNDNLFSVKSSFCSAIYGYFMFYNRKKSRISLVCMDKATTFAPALREKHVSIHNL